MSKLSAYIDNMFIGLPETDEVLEAKRIIKENMTEKYEDLIAQGKNEAEAFGTVAGEFGSMEELCQEMGWDFTRGSQGSFDSHATFSGAQSQFKDAAEQAVNAAGDAVSETAGEVNSWWKTWNTRENRRILGTLIVRYILTVIIISILKYFLKDFGASILLIGVAVLFVSFYPKSPLYVYKERVAKEAAQVAAEEAAKAEAQAVAAAIAATNGADKDKSE